MAQGPLDEDTVKVVRWKMRQEQKKLGVWSGNFLFKSSKARQGGNGAGVSHGTDYDRTGPRPDES